MDKNTCTSYTNKIKIIHFKFPKFLKHKPNFNYFLTSHALQHSISTAIALYTSALCRSPLFLLANPVFPQKLRHLCTFCVRYKFWSCTTVSSVGVVTGPLARHVASSDFDPGRRKRLFSSPRSPDRTPDPTHLVTGPFPRWSNGTGLQLTYHALASSSEFKNNRSFTSIRPPLHSEHRNNFKRIFYYLAVIYLSSFRVCVSHLVTSSSSSWVAIDRPLSVLTIITWPSAHNNDLTTVVGT